MNEPTPNIDRVFEYIRNNALCTRVQIAKALGIGGGTASTCLTYLRELGEIKGVRSENVNAAVLWEVGTEDGVDELARQKDAPIRPIVNNWVPHLRRDPLVTALFGS